MRIFKGPRAHYVAYAIALALMCEFVVRPAGAQDSHAAVKKGDKLVSAAEREKYLARSQIHSDTDVASKIVMEGPAGPGAFSFREEVDCVYEPDALPTGNSPKFACLDSAGKELKVKYGCNNGEVFGEVAATRLLWLLGFEADRMYPVIVRCRNCPPLPAANPEENASGRFVCAAIERKAGEEIEAVLNQGWHWDEINKVSVAAGGASRAHIDALKLMAVLLQHNDSKPDNQRIVCTDDSWSADAANGENCSSPKLVVQDVGATFGGAGNRVREDSKVDLVHWREQRIWRDGSSCTANLAGSTRSGTISDPVISEEGRAFLAGLLRKVRASQIRDVFTVAQVTTRDRGSTLEAWQSAFWYKAYQIINHRCSR